MINGVVIRYNDPIYSMITYTIILVSLYINNIVSKWKGTWEIWKYQMAIIDNYNPTTDLILTDFYVKYDVANAVTKPVHIIGFAR